MLKKLLFASLFCLCLFGVSYGQTPESPTTIPPDNPPRDPPIKIFEIRIPINEPKPPANDPPSQPSKPQNEPPKKDPWEGLRGPKKPE